MRFLCKHETPSGERYTQINVFHTIATLVAALSSLEEVTYAFYEYYLLPITKRLNIRIIQLIAMIKLFYLAHTTCNFLCKHPTTAHQKCTLEIGFGERITR